MYYAYVSCQLAAFIMNTTDEWAAQMSNGDVTGWQTSDFDCFGMPCVDIWSLSRDYCRSKCHRVYECVCDFHVNWLHVSRIRPTHWRQNDGIDVNQCRHRLTPFHKTYLCLCVCVCFIVCWPRRHMLFSTRSTSETRCPTFSWLSSVTCFRGGVASR